MTLSPAQQKVLAPASEDNPAIVFAWHLDAVNMAVAYLNTPAAPPRPPWMTQAPTAMTAESLTREIVLYAAAISTGAKARLGNVVIAPLTLAACKGRVVVVSAFQMFCQGSLTHGLPQLKRIAERRAA